jgi:anti-sigma regulatory factor (Ser/Thr protein kinase)
MVRQDRDNHDPARVRLRVPAVPTEVATVRHAVVAAAAAHGISDGPREDIALAVSEACSNVVVHAYRHEVTPGPLAVDAYRDDGEFFVVVCDEGIGMAPRADSPGLGLGLGLMAGLAKRLEIGSQQPAGASVTMVFGAPDA